jgi:hypothetical protein
MDIRITDLADRLANEVDPQIAVYVKELAANGMSYDDIMARLRRAMKTAEAARQVG